ncbi:hypothetical protein KIP69_05550 [Geobacter sulfurreducens]|uniref:hypothetical protein n=1 Tax=Geobacter sulfurreducens TaxID=35554 RepID=UPI000DBB15BA|nr:hypothetical protein [Geobacter sulfurreducens]QVW36315.1 hypothetical protein KIP69_05550 [Geobacter sulfurreducens]BBA69615.1 hypothetical protein YM18_1068 [Geobacter sulfurreducens]
MTIACPQCGAPAEARTDTRFHGCAFCGSSFMVERGIGIAEYHLEHERDDRVAWSALASTLERDGAGQAVERTSCEYLVAPFWLSRPESGGNRLVPALRHPWLQGPVPGLPGGDLLFVPALNDFILPDIPADEALGEGAGRGGTSLSLIYLPLYFLSFRLAGHDCRALVSAVDRRVALLTPLPLRSESVPFRHAALVAGFAITLTAAGLAVKSHLLRAAVFAAVLAVAWPVCTALLRRGE